MVIFCKLSYNIKMRKNMLTRCIGFFLHHYAPWSQRQNNNFNKSQHFCIKKIVQKNGCVFFGFFLHHRKYALFSALFTVF